MNIVVTDGYTLNPGDLDRGKLDSLGHVQWFARTSRFETVARTFPADIIVTNKTIIDADVIAAASHLKLIAVTATGYNNVDVLAANQRGIKVCNVPGYGTFSVAQHVFALLLHCTNHVASNAESVYNGEWQTAPDWCYTHHPIMELHSKTLGIVGMGKIGNQVATIANAFGMAVIYSGGRTELPFARPVDLNALFLQADVVSLHCPLTNDNAEMVNAERIGLMKPSAILINTARGALVKERDLAQALEQKRIAFAALDVFGEEPPGVNNPLVGLANCIITPHTAWLSVEARRRILQITCGNIQSFLLGSLENEVKG